MRHFVIAYRKAVESAFSTHMKELGFSLKRDRYDMLVAESQVCRVFFHPQQFILLVQRISDGPREESPIYGLDILLRSCSSDSDLNMMPIQNAESVASEVDRMVRLLIEKCRLILEDDKEAWQNVARAATEAENTHLSKMAEAGVLFKEGERWRELPELDSVAVDGDDKLANTTIAVLAGMVTGLVTIGLSVGVVQTGRKFGFNTFFLSELFNTLLVLVPLLALQGWLFHRMIRGEYRLRTDPNGLSVEHWRKKRVIAWDDIDSAGIAPGRFYQFRTPKGQFRIGKAALKSPEFEASIWQHLNRRQKADRLPLSPFAASLWAAIPADKAQSVQWENPNTWRQYRVAWIHALLIAAAFGLTLRFDLLNTSMVAVPFLIPVMVIHYWVSTGLIMARSIRADNVGIDATRIFGSFATSWKQVKSVKFHDAGMFSDASLEVRAGHFSAVRIPWIPDHPNSTRVMLTILRRLRQEDGFRSLPFPVSLLMAVHDETLRE